jgi:hypothetical protein
MDVNKYSAQIERLEVIFDLNRRADFRCAFPQLQTRSPSCRSGVRIGACCPFGGRRVLPRALEYTVSLQPVDDAASDIFRLGLKVFLRRRIDRV